MLGDSAMRTVMICITTSVVAGVFVRGALAEEPAGKGNPPLDLKAVDDLIAKFKANPDDEDVTDALHDISARDDVPDRVREKIGKAFEDDIRRRYEPMAKNVDALIRKYRNDPSDRETMATLSLLANMEMVSEKDQARIREAIGLVERKEKEDAEAELAADAKDVDALLARYAAEPESAELALRLAALLEEGKMKGNAAKRVLKAAWQHALVVRETYEAGKPAYVSLNHPFGFSGAPPVIVIGRQTQRLGDARVSDVQIAVDGEPCGYKPELRVQQLVKTRRAQSEGMFGAAYTAMRSRELIRLAWDRQAVGGHVLTISFTYSAGGFGERIELAAELRIVPAGEAEKVKFRSGGDLDAKMRAAFALTGSYGITPHDGKADPQKPTLVKWYKGLPIIVCESLPENFVYRAVFRGEDGREQLLDEHLVVHRDGPKESLRLSYDRLEFDAAGDYLGTLVLSANRRAAQDDPMIKTAWGGTVEFPMTVKATWEKRK